MKKITLLIVICGVFAYATDYSSMSISDLQSLRGTVPIEDKAAFQSAMQSKMPTATTNEKSAMRQSKSGATTGSGSQYRKGKK
ncbi:MAG: hypothetical protein PHR87_04975 [Sulfurospirillaceae bacterium]|nr:hypothetical protein [Sulfurospirillaceae bacterium]